MTYVLHPGVWEDVRVIWEFIAQHNPAAADRVEQQLFDTFARIADNPGIGHRHAHIKAKATPATPITVLAVVHGA
ncbi:MAG: type II toxin-antitoxin system RelE/ParE family toxin [bacterium]|nr:type II toxin-antitoxin system RelE/ParE family toxin [bacterium]